jgi:hypothetical protein
MTCKLRIALGAFVALAFQTNQAFAGRITGVTATTDMGSGFGTSLVNTLNGNGLSEVDPKGWTKNSRSLDGAAG